MWSWILNYNYGTDGQKLKNLYILWRTFFRNNQQNSSFTYFYYCQVIIYSNTCNTRCWDIVAYKLWIIKLKKRDILYFVLYFANSFTLLHPFVKPYLFLNKFITMIHIYIFNRMLRKIHFYRRAFSHLHFF